MVVRWQDILRGCVLGMSLVAGRGDRRGRGRGGRLCRAHGRGRPRALVGLRAGRCQRHLAGELGICRRGAARQRRRRRPEDPRAIRRLRSAIRMEDFARRQQRRDVPREPGNRSGVLHRAGVSGDRRRRQRGCGQPGHVRPPRCMPCMRRARTWPSRRASGTRRGSWSTATTSSTISTAKRWSNTSWGATTGTSASRRASLTPGRSLARTDGATSTCRTTATKFGIATCGSRTSTVRRRGTEACVRDWPWACAVLLSVLSGGGAGRRGGAVARDDVQHLGGRRIGRPAARADGEGDRGGPRRRGGPAGKPRRGARTARRTMPRGRLPNSSAGTTSIKATTTRGIISRYKIVDHTPKKWGVGGRVAVGPAGVAVQRPFHVTRRISRTSC